MGIAFFIIVVHYIADFIFQAEEWAENKSKHNWALIMHTLTYTLVWMIPASFLFRFNCNESIFGGCVWSGKMFVFLGVTFVLHTITDYITSRIVSKRFADKYYGSPIPNLGAFSIIGLDQVLHYAQLFGTYYFLSL